MAYAMADLGWKFYLINASWNLIFLVIAYFTFVETKGLKLEEIAAKFEGSQILEAAFAEDNSSQVGGVVPEKIAGEVKEQALP